MRGTIDKEASEVWTNAFPAKSPITVENFPPASNAHSIRPTAFTWQHPDTIPPREWLYGRHLMRGIVSLTVAPGGVGKSSLVIVQALELASGRQLLGHRVGPPVRTWLLNLEDDKNELMRRVVAAMKHYCLIAEDISDRLYIDSGLEQPFRLASEHQDESLLNEALFQELEAVIRRHHIDTVIIDPFVSAHTVNEADNGKVDRIMKRLSRLSIDCNCAIELVHHMRKLNGMGATSEASRGASSLLAAARSSRTIQKASEKDRREWGVTEDTGTYFFVERDKANLAHAGGRESYRTVSVPLGQGDDVAVVERFHPPDALNGISRTDLLSVQGAIDGKDLRFSDQAENWVGYEIARMLTLDAKKDKPRIKKLIEIWLESGALCRVEAKVNGRKTPTIIVGEWAKG